MSKNKSGKVSKLTKRMDRLSGKLDKIETIMTDTAEMIDKMKPLLSYSERLWQENSQAKLANSGLRMLVEELNDGNLSEKELQEKLNEYIKEIMEKYKSKQAPGRQEERLVKTMDDIRKES